MDTSKYVSTMGYPKKPLKPAVPIINTTEEIKEYADKLERYKDDLIIWRAHLAIYDTEKTRVEEEFKKDALEEVGLAGHPEADKIYAYAWQQGHSGGLYNVVVYLQDLAELFLEE